MWDKTPSPSLDKIPLRFKLQEYVRENLHIFSQHGNFVVQTESEMKLLLLSSDQKWSWNYRKVQVQIISKGIPKASPR